MDYGERKKKSKETNRSIRVRQEEKMIASKTGRGRLKKKKKRQPASRCTNRKIETNRREMKKRDERKEEREKAKREMKQPEMHRMEKRSSA